MKAAVSTNIREIQIKEMPKPVPAEGEALIRVAYCGICGSDTGGFQRGDPFAPFPHIFGHETSGVIEEINGGDGSFAVGDRVVYEITKNCGVCPACLDGRREDCSDFKIIGGHLQGAFSEYVCVPMHLIFKVPDNVSLELAAACEPYTVASRGCEKAHVGPGDTVLVLGAGSIALCALACAKERGARVFIAARNAQRLERALQFGPDAVINTKEEDLKARIAELTGGVGCSVIIEATGAKPIIESCVDLARRATRIAMVGMTMDSVSFPALDIITKELKIYGSQNSYYQFPWVLEKFSQGKLNADKFISDVFDYTQAQEAMEYAIANASSCGKVLLRFSGEA